MSVRGRGALITVALAAAWSVTAARANGDLFFEAQEVPGKPEYVVFGTVKDDQGQYLEGADVTIRVAEPVLSYTLSTDFVGRYRTLDVGRAVEGLGYQIDSARIKVSVAYPGYHEVARLYRGKLGQNTGAIELSFTLAKNAAPATSSH